jgi:hypothetical protein
VSEIREVITLNLNYPVLRKIQMFPIGANAMGTARIPYKGGGVKPENLFTDLNSTVRKL